MPDSNCPNSDTLRGIVRGDLADERAKAALEHVQNCTACDAALSKLEKEDWSDSLVRELSQSPEGAEYLGEPELAAAEQQVVAGLAQAESNPTKREADINLAQLASLGSYELLEQIGEGGMGAVYRARHTHLGRVVAVKILPAWRNMHADAVSRFCREMKAAGSLDHPNIVRALDAGEADGTHYLAMEFVDGWDLSDLVQLTGPLRVADACEIIRQLALALQYAHDHGIIHRDIKPANAMVTSDGVVKVLDLGLARFAASRVSQEELTVSGQMLGTVDYMAPEQIESSHSVDHRADVYGLGATLYKLLAGRSPFATKERQPTTARLVAIVRKKPASIRKLRPEVGQELAAIVARMLAKRPDGRYASCQWHIELDLARLGQQLALVVASPRINAIGGPLVTLRPAKGIRLGTEHRIERLLDRATDHLVHM